MPSRPRGIGISKRQWRLMNKKSRHNVECCNCSTLIGYVEGRLSAGVGLHLVIDDPRLEFLSEYITQEVAIAKYFSGDYEAIIAHCRECQNKIDKIIADSELKVVSQETEEDSK